MTLLSPNDNNLESYWLHYHYDSEDFSNILFLTEVHPDIQDKYVHVLLSYPFPITVEQIAKD